MHCFDDWTSWYQGWALGKFLGFEMYWASGVCLSVCLYLWDNHVMSLRWFVQVWVIYINHNSITSSHLLFQSSLSLFHKFHPVSLSLFHCFCSFCQYISILSLSRALFFFLSLCLSHPNSFIGPTLSFPLLSTQQNGVLVWVTLFLPQTPCGFGFCYHLLLYQ